MLSSVSYWVRKSCAQALLLCGVCVGVLGWGGGLLDDLFGNNLDGQGQGNLRDRLGQVLGGRSGSQAGTGQAYGGRGSGGEGGLEGVDRRGGRRGRRARGEAPAGGRRHPPAR